MRVVARILGVPVEMSDTFTGWVRDLLEFANDEERRTRGRTEIIAYLTGAIAERRERPGDDLISYLLDQEVDGEPLSERHVLGPAGLTLIAGIDTTWSAIGATLWHLATNDDDRVVLDREHNRHVAFGVGIHRCAGSNLARMELRVAVEEWLAAIPDFVLADGATVTWAGGQVRGRARCR